MLESLVQGAENSITHFFSKLSIHQLEKAIDLCCATPGLLVFTGVGKSGLVAEKTAATLVSTGTRALFVQPGNFLHGDLGIVAPSDLFIAISKTGETEELLELIPFVRKKGAKMLAVVSRPESRLARAADLVVELPVERELGPFDLIPTISTTVQLIFGDLLAMGILSRKEFTREQFATNHPGGSIGKALTTYVRDLMLTGDDLPTASPEDRLLDVLVVLSNKRCGAVLVTSADGELLGIFTDGDLRRSIQLAGDSLLSDPVHRWMTRSPLTVSPSLLAVEAKQRMQLDPKRWVSVLPVVEQGKVIGILRLHDIVHSGL